MEVRATLAMMAGKIRTPRHPREGRTAAPTRGTSRLPVVALLASLLAVATPWGAVGAIASVPPGETPSPAPSAEPGIAPEPSPSPEVSPSPEPSPSPDPSPSPSPSPSPTPTPSPSARSISTLPTLAPARAAGRRAPVGGAPGAFDQPPEGGVAEPRADAGPLDRPVAQRHPLDRSSGRRGCAAAGCRLVRGSDPPRGVRAVHPGRPGQLGRQLACCVGTGRDRSSASTKGRTCSAGTAPRCSRRRTARSRSRRGCSVAGPPTSSSRTAATTTSRTSRIGTIGASPRATRSIAATSSATAGTRGTRRSRTSTSVGTGRMGPRSIRCGA